ncbi:hypothetical protein QEZ54_17905 [Catellatospora sp. KI3]|uniref:hypothetical protein n=1 Tax=Catellatospora sp. KI3 TaxID=3041620 RepID=UPI002482C6D2|nr:hypothetical protein [Catellatospora sp. KI3]MDI1462853.1 hypothetical protein [Catellatospora sp. KI3]
MSGERDDQAGAAQAAPSRKQDYLAPLCTWALAGLVLTLMVVDVFDLYQVPWLSKLLSAFNDAASLLLGVGLAGGAAFLSFGRMRDRNVKPWLAIVPGLCAGVLTGVLLCATVDASQPTPDLGLPQTTPTSPTQSATPQPASTSRPPSTSPTPSATPSPTTSPSKRTEASTEPSPVPSVAEDPDRHVNVQHEQVVELDQIPKYNWVDIENWRHDATKPGELQIDAQGVTTALGAKLAIMPDTPLPNEARCSRVTAWQDRVEFSSLHVGSQLCGRSRDGRFASLDVRLLPNPASGDGRFIFYGITWN